MNLVDRARAFAYARHGDQKRKYTNEPYVVHLEEVFAIVKTVPHTEEMLAAALLHDTVEDTDTTHDEIRAEFGEKVALFVYYLTDVSKKSDGNRKVRKAIDRDHIAQGPPESQTIKYADVISNGKDIAKNDPDFAVVYLREKDELLAVADKGDPTLLAQAKKLMLIASETLT